MMPDENTEKAIRDRAGRRCECLMCYEGQHTTTNYAFLTSEDRRCAAGIGLPAQLVIRKVLTVGQPDPENPEHWQAVCGPCATPHQKRPKDWGRPLEGKRRRR